MLTVTGTASRTRVLSIGPSVRSRRELVLTFNIFVFDFSKLACFLKRRFATENPNIEIRNSKQYRNQNAQNSKQNISESSVWVLAIDILVIGICFEFRASNLLFAPQTAAP